MYFFSEWLMTLHAGEIQFHLYKLPVRNYEEKDYENGSLSRLVAKMNGDPVVAFYGPYIGSFEELKKWPEGYEKEHEYRAIDLENERERKLLQRLILNGIGKANKSEYHHDYGTFVAKKGDSIEGIRVHKGIHLDVLVEPNGNIIIGFDMKFRLFYEKNLFQMMQTEHVVPGMGVFDPYTGTHYEFVGQLDQTVSDPMEPGEPSPIEYYRTVKKRPDLVAHIPPQTPAVKVKKKGRNARPYTYIPQLLKLECHYSGIDPTVKKQIRLSTNQKTNQSAKLAGRLIRRFDQTLFPYELGPEPKNLQAKATGYRIVEIDEPVLRVGNDIKVKDFRRIKNALREGGVYAPPKEPLKYQYLIDHDVYSHSQSLHMKDFAEELEKTSRAWGVPLKRMNIIKQISFSNPSQLRLKLKELDWDPSVVTAVIFHKKNESRYQLIKNELGRNQGVMTQFIQLETTDNTYAIPQILLGIYAKGGIQPWVLDQPLHASCFVGFDVSHDQGKHATGIVQVFGYDGRPVWVQPFSSNEAGEKLGKESIQRIVIEVIHRFKKEYGRSPENIVFHRDGTGHKEEQIWISEVLNELDEPIDFDYVSVIKNANRRMARLETSATEKRYVNIPGTAYIKGNIAYLCSTDPSDFVGMAKPIKIHHHTGPTPMEHLVEDIYHLSYMNIHTDRRVRLPVTINYADKSSTFFNKGMMPENPVLKGIASV